MSSSTPANSNNHDDEPVSSKQILWIRHGCSYMNEYLSQPGCHYGAPDFTDIFHSQQDFDKHRDARLSLTGQRQAQALRQRLELAGMLDSTDDWCIVTSPLTRALETLQLGVLPLLPQNTRVLAQPLASERVYLISDWGRHRDELEHDYPHIDFGMLPPKQNWWYTSEYTKHPFPNEWRPNGHNQRYACAGEDQTHFQQRMLDLYQWLNTRPETNILVLCHWGVIDYMLQRDFDNCEYQWASLDEVASRFPTLDRQPIDNQDDTNATAAQAL